MFGVFIRRWKPKRTSNADRNESPEAEGNISPEPPDRPPGKARQVHPEDKTQVLAYDSTFKKKPKALPLEDNYSYNHLANTNVAMSPMYPLTPNICVEGGKIEFIKSPTGSARNSVALVSPPQTPLVARRGSRDKREARIYDEPTEKFDGDKEVLERRIKQLESQLEEEKSRTQRERMSVTKLQNKLIKVALILGINGACRAMELTNITTKDIEFQGDIIIFKLCDTKNKTDRSFIIRDEFMNIFMKYYALRPKNTATERLFLNYQKGKCTKQVIGRHKILNMPRTIATFLNLDSPHLYTGHCFRRTSATLLADSGANLLTVKRHGGWKSDRTAENYIDDSIGVKEETTKNITKNIILARTNTRVTPHENLHLQPSIYDNPQPGCSRDPPDFIERQSPTKCTVDTVPGSLSSLLDINYLQDTTQAGVSNPLPSSPPQQNNKANEQSKSHNVLSQPGPSSEIQQTNISVPGKTITITITNCPNMSNITFNIN